MREDISSVVHCLGDKQDMSCLLQPTLAKICQVLAAVAVAKFSDLGTSKMSKTSFFLEQEFLQ